jgi:uncharacterized repeat protein (TIGR01451 family)
MVSARTRKGLTLLWTALFLCSLLLQYASFAAPASTFAADLPDKFELDGNAADSATAGDDWQSVVGGTSGAFASAFINDVTGAGDNIFTGGGSKDVEDITSWAQTTGTVQDKNDIDHAFAAAYNAADGDLLVYFGLDRYAQNGAAQVGFWFLRSAGNPFGHGHQVGDVLVQIDFENGGTNPIARVYEWNGSGITLVSSGTTCAGIGTGDRCAISNTTNQNTVWSFNPKSGANDVYQPGHFVEGGINLTDLKLDDGCFATFFAETRSSPSEDSTLSDYGFGSFPLCVAPNIATQVKNDQGKDAAKINKGESVTDHVVVSGSKGVAKGTVDFYVCGPTQSATACSTGGTQVGNDIALVNGEADSTAFTPSAIGWYCFRAEYTPSAGSKYLADSHTNATTECVRVIPADVQIVKTPNDGSASAGDQISFTLSWTNEGEGKATGVVVSDDLPTTAGLDWSIDSSTGAGSTCANSGAVGAQQLTCNVGSIDGNPNFPNAAPVDGTVVLVSDTTKATCGAVNNTGKITSNNDGTDTDPGKITVLCPDIKVTKTPDGGSVNAGEVITWTIKVENLGPGSATGVVVDDNLPSGIDWSESEADCDITGAVGSEKLHCTVGTLAKDASKSYQVSGTTDKTDCGVVNNTGTVSATNEPAAANGNNSDPGDVTVKCADIQITKTADAKTVSAGDPIGFVLHVSNAGTGTATGVVVTDVLPTNAGLSWSVQSITGDGSPSCGILDGTLTCTAASLAATKSFDVHIVSGTTSASCGVVDNTGSVVAGNDGSDEASDSLTVQCPDLEVVKGGNGTINAGEDAVFTITLTNHGPGAAKNVTLSDQLPAGSWTLGGADKGACSINGSNLLTCTFGTVAKDGQKVITLTQKTTAAQCGSIPNTVTVSASNENTDADQYPNTDNDTIVVQCPDIAVVKSGNGPLSAGQTAAFTIKLTNAGPGDAKGVTLSDQLPAGSWTLGGADAAACSINGSNLLTCDFGTVLAGGSRTITVSKATAAGDCPSIHNDVTVAASNEPASATDDNDSGADIVVNCPDIEVVKSGNGPISAGQAAVFSITVKNLGPGVASGVTLADQLPAGTWTLGGPNAADCGITKGKLTCDFGTLIVNATRTITLSRGTVAADCGQIPNTVTVEATNEGADVLENDTSSASIVVDCPLIVITKTADAEEVTAGDQVGFKVEVTNTGAGSAFAVAVDDVLPAGLAWTIDGANSSAGWSIANGHLTFGPATLASKTSTHVHIVATTTAADCGVIPNLASLTFQGGSGSDDASVIVDCPNITVDKSGNGPIVNGQTATFSITVTNAGPGTARDVTLTDQLTAGTWTLGGPDAADCAINGSNKLTCDFGDIAAPGGQNDNVRQISVSTTADVDDCGTIPNHVTVGASNEAADDTTDNADDATIDVRCPTIDIDKTVDDSTVEPNQTVTYTVHVQVVNGPVTNAVVTDDLPDGQTYTPGSASPSEPVVSNGGKTLTWTFASLPSGDPAVTITYDVTIDADASGDAQENEATVCVEEPTPCASDVALVNPGFPGLTIIKTAGDAADGEVYATEPGPVTFHYHVTNDGPLPLHDVTVTDDNGTPADPSDDFTATCPKTTLAAGESMDCSATHDVLVDTTNVAVARGVTEEGNPVEDDDDADVVVLTHGLVIDKSNDAPVETIELPDGSTVDMPTADEGDTVTYTLDYTFSGDPVTKAIITDVLPVGVTYVDHSATSDDQFTFQGYVSATRTLTWTADSVSKSGTLSYEATIDVGASELDQPLVNVATIDSDQTEPDTDDSDVFVPTIPLPATGTPRTTLPPTDTVGDATPPPASNPGFSLMLILLALGAIVLVIGFVTPVPASVRERSRR